MTFGSSWRKFKCPADLRDAGQVCNRGGAGAPLLALARER